MSEPVDDVQCPLCDAVFPGRESCPQGCPLAHSCRTVCCPNCHYRFVVQSRLIGWMQRLWEGRRA